MRLFASLALVLGASLPAAAVTVTCNNNSGDPTLVQNAFTTGGAITFVGTCNTGTSQINANAAATVTGGTFAATSSYTGWTFAIGTDNVTFAGSTFTGAGVHVTGSFTTQRNNISFNGCTFRDFTTESSTKNAAISVDTIWANSTFRHNTLTNIWAFGFPSTTDIGYPTPNTKGMVGLFISGGLDNTQIENNTFTQILNDGIHLASYGTGNATSGYAATGVSISYNIFTYIHRIGIEYQNCLSQQSGVDCAHQVLNGGKIAGNLYYDPAYTYLDSYAFSLPIICSTVGRCLYINNGAVLNTSGNSTPPQSRAGYAMEMPTGGAWSNGGIAGSGGYTVRGNVVAGETNPAGGSSPGWFPDVFEHYNSNGHSMYDVATTYQNNILCGPGGNTSVGADSFNIDLHNFKNSSVCPATGTAMYASAIASTWTSANNQSFPAGGNGTWSLYGTNPIPFRFVDFYIDGSSTSANHQELSDISTTFDTDRRWVYHYTFNTGVLANGSHTIVAKFTDVSGTVFTTTAQAFTTGGTSPAVSLSPTSLTFASTSVGSSAPTQTITLTNSGTSTLTISSISISGTNAGDYSQTTTCPGTLGASLNCGITVTFSPLAAGSRVAAVNIVDNAAGSPHIAALSGAGVSTACNGVLAGWQNCDFSNGTTSWSFAGTSYANFTANNGGPGGTPQGIVTVTVNPTSNIELYQQGLSLVAGQTYTVSASLKASRAQSSVAYIIKDAPPWTGYATANLAPPSWTTSFAPYSTTFTANATVSDARLTFQFPNSQNGDVFDMQNVTIVSGGTVIPIVLTPSSQSVNVGGSATITANKPVTFSLQSGSVGTITTTSNSATFTAPSTITPNDTRYGCPVQPQDSIWYYPHIDALPLNANNATWMTNLQAVLPTAKFYILPFWGLDVADNTNNATTSNIYGYTPWFNGASIPIPQLNNRQGGLYDFSADGIDHHASVVNRNTCNFSETYNVGLFAYKTLRSCPTCNAGSANLFAASGYGLPPTASTVAGGLPFIPLTIHASEVRAASINHMMFVTLATGFIYSGQSFWPAVDANGSSPCEISLTPTFGTGCVRMGNILRPKAAFCSAHTGAAGIALGYNAMTLALFNAACKHGFIVGDNGTSFQVAADYDVTLDPAVWAAIQAFNGVMGAGDLEVADPSSLQIDPTSAQVSQTSGHGTSSTYSILTATDGTNTVSMPIAVQPVSVGTTFQSLVAVSGVSPNYQIPSWVNGTANQGVTWAMVSGSGTITGGGVYSTPTVSSVTTDVVRGTAAADSTATVTVIITVMPSDAGPAILRIDTGGQGCLAGGAEGCDSLWISDTATPKFNGYGCCGLDFPLWTTAASNNYVWSSLYHAFTSDWNAVGPVIVPNGNYQVTYMSGREGTAGTYPNAYQGSVEWGPVWLDSGGNFGGLIDFGALTANRHYVRVPAAVTAPAIVGNNILIPYMRMWGPGDNLPTYNPVMAGVTITPDSGTTPHWTIDAQQQELAQLTAGSAGTWNCFLDPSQTTQTTGDIPSTLQLRIVDSFTQRNDAQWIATGPTGTSIHPTSGCLTYPSSTPAKSQPIMVQACSASQPSICASQTFWLKGTNDQVELH